MAATIPQLATAYLERAETECYLVERARARCRDDPAPLDRAILAAAVGRRTRRDSGGGSARYAIASRFSPRSTSRTPAQSPIEHTLLSTMPHASAIRRTTSSVMSLPR